MSQLSQYLLESLYSRLNHQDCKCFSQKLFVPDPAPLVARAVAAGASETSPVQDYDYGYRQGTEADPFGHLWLIQRKI